VSGYVQAAGGRRDPASFSYRVEITVCCMRDHALLPFYRLTLPEREHEGVTYDKGRLGRVLTEYPHEPPDVVCAHYHAAYWQGD
jgi:hypothetical protein